MMRLAAVLMRTSRVALSWNRSWVWASLNITCTLRNRNCKLSASQRCSRSLCTMWAAFRVLRCPTWSRPLRCPPNCRMRRVWAPTTRWRSTRGSRRRCSCKVPQSCFSILGSPILILILYNLSLARTRSKASGTSVARTRETLSWRVWRVRTWTAKTYRSAAKKTWVPTKRAALISTWTTKNSSPR